MDFSSILDGYIENLVGEDYSEGQIATLLLAEDTNMFVNGEYLPLLETVKRIRRRVGGFNRTVRKTGRPNPQRSIRARLAARRFASKRKMAARKFARSPRGKRLHKMLSTERRRKSAGSVRRPRRRR